MQVNIRKLFYRGEMTDFCFIKFNLFARFTGNTFCFNMALSVLK